MPRSGWAREPRPLSLRVRSLCSTTGEATAVRGPRTAKKKKKELISRNLIRHDLHGHCQLQALGQTPGLPNLNQIQDT